MSLSVDRLGHPTPRNSRQLTLAMSAPSPDSSKAATYIIDPDKQCGVVKADGNRCTTRLSCRTHGAVEKHAVDRSKPYFALLREQSGLLTPDVHPVAHSADQPNLAPVFDPDEHCGADLPIGQPCTQGIVRCNTHIFKGESKVQGRSVGLDDLERADKANMSRLAWKDGDELFQYNPDTDCGATKTNGERCQNMLSCV
jgi:hypothetical protein